MILTLYQQLKEVADREFSDIIDESEIVYSPAGRARKLRINMIDSTFIDVWYSIEGEYSYHWEHSGVRNYLYRHDNAPHSKWSYVSTFPQHCHEGKSDNVIESYLPQDPIAAMRMFLLTVRKKLCAFRKEE